MKENLVLLDETMLAPLIWNALLVTKVAIIL